MKYKTYLELRKMSIKEFSAYLKECQKDNAFMGALRKFIKKHGG